MYDDADDKDEDDKGNEDMKEVGCGRNTKEG